MTRHYLFNVKENQKITALRILLPVNLYDKRTVKQYFIYAYYISPSISKVNNKINPILY